MKRAIRDTLTHDMIIAGEFPRRIGDNYKKQIINI